MTVNAGRRAWLAIALGIAACAGCAPLAPVSIEVRRAMLDQLPADLPGGDARPATLLVLPPETTPIYDTMRMAYAVQPHEVAYFSRTEWAETPSQMILPLLIQTLEKANCFSTVVAAPFTGRYAYALRTEILALEQDLTSEQPVFRLTLRVQLVAQEGNRVVATREIAMREPIAQGAPYGGVVAANGATAKALAEVARFVRANAG